MTAQKYGRTVVSLHWLIALLVLCNIALGLLHDDVAKPVGHGMIQLHESFGITILILACLRLLWRFTHRLPPVPHEYANWERYLAQTSHVLFYCLIFALPLTGWLHASAHSPDAPLRLYWSIPWFNIGPITGFAASTEKSLSHSTIQVHIYLTYLLYCVLTLHILGALKHQFIDRKPELQRMWY